MTTVLPLTGMAHGGRAVGRLDGRVVFVRGGIPGETVAVEVTGEGRRGRFLEADVIEVVDPSPDRVVPPCPLAGTCGGCDLQHIAVSRQRQLKAEVLTEQVARLGRVEGLPIDVAAVTPDALGWRSRMRFAGTTGGWGLRRLASHDVVPVAECPIATNGVNAALAGAEPPQVPDAELTIVEAADEVVAADSPIDPDVAVTHRAAGRDWQVSVAGFWQPHVAAPDVLVRAVSEHVSAASSWWDLYSGVGLFAGALARPGVTVQAIEGDARAVANARINVSDQALVKVVRADVERWVQRNPEGEPEVVVLDPPRRGAGRAVTEALSSSTASRVVYVACDPAALGRDIGYLRAQGWSVASIRGFDLFPMTHHVEAVAVLDR